MYILIYYTGIMYVHCTLYMYATRKFILLYFVYIGKTRRKNCVDRTKKKGKYKIQVGENAQRTSRNRELPYLVNLCQYPLLFGFFS